jgi:intron-binding protein aquarius
MVLFYDCFDIDDVTGLSLSQSQLIDAHYRKVQQLQRVAFLHFPELKNLALSSVALLQNRETLTLHLDKVF